VAFECASTIDVGREQVAIAIQAGILGSHLGLMFRDADGVMTTFHLAFHRLVVVDQQPPAPGEWLACVIPFGEQRAKRVASTIRGMAKVHKLYPFGESPVDYGLSLLLGQGAISKEGVYSPLPGRDGFTCATLLADLLQRSGAKLVDPKTWVGSPKGEAWGRAIVCMLRAWRSATEEHVQKVERGNAGVRMRPEEVAAAGETYEGKPKSQAELAARAIEVFDEVQHRCAAAAEPSDPAMKACVVTYMDEVATL
jgi:hypothetical protein